MPTGANWASILPEAAAAAASGKIDAQLAPVGILPQVKELKEKVDPEQFEEAMPDAWIDQLAIVGTVEDWKIAIDRFVEAGANSVVLVPIPGKSIEELETFAGNIQQLRSKKEVS